ncbi:hypothetical protein ABE073_04385 [Lederbergia citrisecunda]
MDTYQCETCDITVEITKWEAFWEPDEAYEFGQCQECFDKSVHQ